MKNKNFGFTLMELLVVIVIIGILATLLFPVFGRVQENGREVKCASNLRQLHTAAMSFVNSSGGLLPRAASAKVWKYDEATGQYGFSWQTGWVASHPMTNTSMKSYWWNEGGSNGTYCIQEGTLFPYLGDAGDESVYVCPTMLRRAREVFSDERSNVTRSYGMNMDLSYVAYSDIDGISRKILFADQGFDQMSVGGINALQYLSNTADATRDPDPSAGAELTQRFFRGIDGSIDFKRQSTSHADTREYLGELHGRKPGANTGMANAIFADGHVERVGYVNTTNVCSGNWEYGTVPQ